MLSNFLKIALRNLLKFKTYSVINISGLALGLGAGLLIMLYVLDELSVDQFHSQKDRIYKVITTSSPTKTRGSETNGWPIGEILRNDFPEVESMVYMRYSGLQIKHDGKFFSERSFYASDDFFKIFSFPMLEGSPESALKEPYSVVLTETLARKYFPDGPAFGKTMMFADTIPFQVTGVMADVPLQSHMQFGMLLSFATWPALGSGFSYDGGWGNINVRNYVLLKDGADLESFRKKAKGIYMDRRGDDFRRMGWEAYVDFEPLNDVYLRSRSGNSMGQLGSIERIYLVTGIAVFVILLACINFVNLSTARSVHRAKEVGLRMVVGSARIALVRQFLLESFVVSLISFVVGIGLVAMFLPQFNTMLTKAYSLNNLLQPFVIAGGIIMLLLVTLLAGYYPAWVISSLRPTEALKGGSFGSSRSVILRRALVILQFVISVALVSGTLIVVDQLDFMRTQSLGFDKNQIIVVNIARTMSRAENSAVIKSELENLAGVQKVSFTNSVPGRQGWKDQISYSENTPKDKSVAVEYLAIDEDYVETLNMEMVAGRDFDEARTTDEKEGLLLNEKAAQMYGWENPADAVNKKITSPSGFPEGIVLGVVKNFHQFGLQQPIGPIVMDIYRNGALYFVIRYQASATSQIIASVETLWNKHFPENEFNYFFLDQDFERQYQAEERLARVFVVFSCLTILIASIGLFGLASFMVTSRTKEIGIRKVLGAGVMSITGLLSKEFMTLVVVANVISAPFVIYFSGEWLNSFANRTTVGPGLFIITFLVASGLAFLTVSFQTIRAAKADPVESIRHE